MFHTGAKRKRTNPIEFILGRVQKTKSLIRDANAGNLNRVFMIIQIKRAVTWGICRWISVGSCGMA